MLDTLLRGLAGPKNLAGESLGELCAVGPDDACHGFLE
jgi:hypothetical protein